MEDYTEAEYVPPDNLTQEEIDTYCKFLGLDQRRDKDLTWIVEEALKAPLPSKWIYYQHKRDGMPFFYNTETGESTSEHPLDQYYKDKFEKEKVKKLKNLQSHFVLTPTKNKTNNVNNDSNEVNEMDVFLINNCSENNQVNNKEIETFKRDAQTELDNLHRKHLQKLAELKQQYNEEIQKQEDILTKQRNKTQAMENSFIKDYSINKKQEIDKHKEEIRKLRVEHEEKLRAIRLEQEKELENAKNNSNFNVKRQKQQLESEFQDECEKMNKKLEQLKEQYENDRKKLKSENKEEMLKIKTRHEEELKIIKDKHNENLVSLTDSQKAEITEFIEQHKRYVECMRKKHEEKIKKIREKASDHLETVKKDVRDDTLRYYSAQFEFTSQKKEYEKEVINLDQLHRKKMENLRDKFNAEYLKLQKENRYKLENLRLDGEESLRKYRKSIETEKRKMYQDAKNDAISKVKEKNDANFGIHSFRIYSRKPTSNKQHIILQKSHPFSLNIADDDNFNVFSMTKAFTIYSRGTSKEKSESSITEIALFEKAKKKKNMMAHITATDDIWSSDYSDDFRIHERLIASPKASKRTFKAQHALVQATDRVVYNMDQSFQSIESVGKQLKTFCNENQKDLTKMTLEFQQRTFELSKLFSNTILDLESAHRTAVSNIGLSSKIAPQQRYFYSPQPFKRRNMIRMDSYEDEQDTTTMRFLRMYEHEQQEAVNSNIRLKQRFANMTERESSSD